MRETASRKMGTMPIPEEVSKSLRDTTDNVRSNVLQVTPELQCLSACVQVLQPLRSFKQYVISAGSAGSFRANSHLNPLYLRVIELMYTLALSSV